MLWWLTLASTQIINYSGIILSFFFSSIKPSNLLLPIRSRHYYSFILFALPLSLSLLLVMIIHQLFVYSNAVFRFGYSIYGICLTAKGITTQGKQKPASMHCTQAIGTQKKSIMIEVNNDFTFYIIYNLSHVYAYLLINACSIYYRHNCVFFSLSLSAADFQRNAVNKE